MLWERGSLCSRLAPRNTIGVQGFWWTAQFRWQESRFCLAAPISRWRCNPRAYEVRIMIVYFWTSESNFILQSFWLSCHYAILKRYHLSTPAFMNFIIQKKTLGLYCPNPRPSWLLPMFNAEYAAFCSDSDRLRSNAWTDDIDNNADWSPATTLWQENPFHQENAAFSACKCYGWSAGILILIRPREDDRQKPLATYPLYIFLRLLYL